MIHPVPAEYVATVWDDVEPLLQKGVDKSNGEYETEDFFRFLLEQYQQLYVVVREEQIVAAIITEVVTYPRRKALRLIHAGGAYLKEWGPELWDVMEGAANAIGADQIEAHGRKGWARYLKSLGPVKEMVVLTRKLR